MLPLPPPRGVLSAKTPSKKVEKKGVAKKEKALRHPALGVAEVKKTPPPKPSRESELTRELLESQRQVASLEARLAEEVADLSSEGECPDDDGASLAESLEGEPLEKEAESLKRQLAAALREKEVLIDLLEEAGPKFGVDARADEGSACNAAFAALQCRYDALSQKLDAERQKHADDLKSSKEAAETLLRERENARQSREKELKDEFQRSRLEEDHTIRELAAQYENAMDLLDNHDALLRHLLALLARSTTPNNGPVAPRHHTKNFDNNPNNRRYDLTRDRSVPPGTQQQQHEVCHYNSDYHRRVVIPHNDNNTKPNFSHYASSPAAPPRRTYSQHHPNATRSVDIKLSV